MQSGVRIACKLEVAYIKVIVRFELEASLLQISHFFVGSFSISAITNLENKLRFVSSCFVMKFFLLNSKFDLEINRDLICI